MTEPHDPSRDDADIDRLLRDFFAREMPPELRSPSRLALTDALRPAPPQRRRVAIASIAALAACGLIALVAWNASPRSAPAPPDGAPRSAPRSDAGLATSPSESTSTLVTPAVADGPQFSSGPTSPVATPLPATQIDRTLPEAERSQSSDTLRTNTRVPDSETGAPVEISVPAEIPVEILPLDGDSRTVRRLPAQQPPDVRLPEERGRDDH